MMWRPIRTRETKSDMTQRLNMITRQAGLVIQAVKNLCTERPDDADLQIKLGAILDLLEMKDFQFSDQQNTSAAMLQALLQERQRLQRSAVKVREFAHFRDVQVQERDILIDQMRKSESTSQEVRQTAISEIFGVLVAAGPFEHGEHASSITPCHQCTLQAVMDIVSKPMMAERA
jgi:hypothetical protein